MGGNTKALETLPGKAVSEAAKMPIAVKDVVRLLCSISDQKKMRVPVQPSNKSAQLLVTGAVVGSFLGGSPGLIFGKCQCLAGAASLGLWDKGLRSTESSQQSASCVRGSGVEVASVT